MRLFTFGCSMTAYHYPTWADIVGKNFAFFQNWGRPGAGNNYILNAVNRCHLQNKFTPDDTIIVLWSGLARNDYFQIDHWGHEHQQFYQLKDKDSHFCCPDGYQWLSFAWMQSILHMLKNLNVSYMMFHWQPIDQATQAYELYRPMFDQIRFSPFDSNQKPYPMHVKNLDTVRENYQKIAGPDWPGLENILNKNYLKSQMDPEIVKEIDKFLNQTSQDPRLKTQVYQTDNHPSPKKHLSWVQKYLPHCNISTDTIAWIEDLDHKVLTQQPYDFNSKQI